MPKRLFFALFLASSAAFACDVTLNLGGADGGAGVDAAAPTCASTCTRIIDTCKLAPADQEAYCLSQCTMYARASDLLCVAQTACFAIVDLCANGQNLTSDAATFDANDPALAEYEISICQNGCDISFMQMCSSAAEHSSCRDACASESSSRRNAYASCAEGASDCSRQADCLTELEKD